MNQIKNIIALLLTASAICSFVELFREDNTEEIMVFLLGTMIVSALFAKLILISKQQ